MLFFHACVTRCRGKSVLCYRRHDMCVRDLILPGVEAAERGHTEVEKMLVDAVDNVRWLIDVLETRYALS